MTNAAKWKEFLRWWGEYRKKVFPGQAVIVRMDVDLEIKELQKKRREEDQ